MSFYKNIWAFVFLPFLLVACGRQAGYTLPTPEDVVMYQINPRVFAPSKSFNAVGLQLDSIKELGVNVVWFMPIYEVGKEKSVNSPYCIRDYKALNPEFGTFEEFKALVDQCHEKGMSVIVDWVANHTSWDNPWIQNKEWYTQDESGNIISPAGTGWNDVADLDFNNPDMRLSMIDAMKYWVVNAGIDGFRCDAADFVPYDFWKQAIDTLRAIPDRKLLMLAEGKRKDHFNAGFEMDYAWDFLEAMRNVYVRDSSATLIFDADSLEYADIPAGKVKLRFTTNHDESSKMSPVKEFRSVRGSMSAFVASTYIHGGALIYGSQEVGYPDPINFFEYVPVDWSSNSALRDEYKKIMSLYNCHPAIRKGAMEKYPDDDVLLFVKRSSDENILVAINVRNETEDVIVPEMWRNHLCLDLMSGNQEGLKDTLLLAPFEYRVFKY